jgi:radical SAM protein with 4Fe4S-binding SPASM domain
LPVKKAQCVNWAHHRQVVLRALEYAGPEWVTNDPQHTAQLSDRFVRDTCLQQIQYYIDFEGQFLYPCDEFPNQKVGSVFEQSLDRLWQAGVRHYGPYPLQDGVCAHCPSGCHSDNSHIFTFPERQLRDLA